MDWEGLGLGWMGLESGKVKEVGMVVGLCRISVLDKVNRG